MPESGNAERKIAKRPNVIEKRTQMEHAMANRPMIRAAGEYLLSVLETKPEIYLSRFHSSNPLRAKAVTDGLRPFFEAAAKRHPEEIESCREIELLTNAFRYIGWAAEQLADIGVVRMLPLGYWLGSRDPDFIIALTSRGEEFIEDGEVFGYRNVESRINAEPASGALIRYLLDRRYPTHTLYEAMRSSGLERGVTVFDDCGNGYGFGTASFVWAFFVSLWHHVDEGIISSTPTTKLQQAIWELLMTNHKLFLCRPRMSDPHPLFDVPLWLTPKGRSVPSAGLSHVTWVGGE
jgi:hypothetical protein